MPFDFSNAPISFESYINKIFPKNHDIFVVVYWDNILIYIKVSSQSYIETV